MESNLAKVLKELVLATAPLTAKEIASGSRLGDRQVRAALQALKEAGCVAVTNPGRGAEWYATGAPLPGKPKARLNGNSIVCPKHNRAVALPSGHCKSCSRYYDVTGLEVPADAQPTR